MDVYYPISYKDKKVFGYDVNSLYPSVMANSRFPTGSPTYFKGDIREIYPNALGFFNVKITAPDNIQVPILLTRTEQNQVLAPVGTWEGMYFSPGGRGTK